ncbi:MAG: 4Fe-4S dicluster domain-containing protein [Desulfobulbaceae bacterium]|nr:4Fe-4S dicluster domain-containing protein [Desulfobulbaceae bacterium]
MENRRKFIKKSGLLVIGAVAVAHSESLLAKESPEKWAMIIDLNRCTGCQSCVVACKNQSKSGQGQFNTKILSVESGDYPSARLVYTPVQCNQCDTPPCVEACPAGATFKLANGIVVTDWNKCQSKGDCVSACPYGARFQDPRHQNKADKCDFCLDRLQIGLEPACVELCPSKARIFGNMNNPQGEFATYLNKTKLTERKADLQTGPQVHYLPSRHDQEGII